MKNKIVFLTVLTVPLLPLSSMALAGFEWTPAKQMVQPAPQPAVQASMQMDYSGMNAPQMAPVPLAPVVSEPLDMPQQNIATQMRPVPMMPATPVVNAVPQSTKKGGLYIDPYPLQSKQMKAPTSYQEMAKALNVKSGGLNPVQLGGGLNTGAKSSRVAMVAPTGSMGKNKSPATFGTGSLTPMLGNDEPAPLAGYGLNNTVDRQDLRQYSQAVGFGSNLPMALAISQVVPNDYSHRFEGDVDTSVMVDWEGGKPWNLVLNDMLRAKNLMADIQGNVVVIKKIART